MYNAHRLEDRVVAITGAGRGIGKATAELLQRYGVKLALGSRNIPETKEPSVSDNQIHLQVDVTKEESVKDFCEKSTDYFGKVDVLINAAGTGKFANVLDSETADFDEMVAVNLRGTYLMCKYFGRQMKKNGQGQMINLVSIAGNTALAGGGSYTASKFGVLGLSKVLQTELRQEGIYTTSVLPGSVDSSFWDGMEQTPDKTKMIPVESIAEHLVLLLCQPPQSVVDEITIMPPAGIL
ncbi:SDR family oxidoreductase [Virgibacillus senegalensis]|uniref:SDR family oxidoreductase n=1 Tax=Virgibacillus senegalensis TaxID=1499679 RepID=UPI00069D0341|nr:SDR family oxidoreductase [Virgibacillus senegalensis]